MVPMSRPSTTMPPVPMVARCRATRPARTSGMALTGLTAAVTRSQRIASETSSPSRTSPGASGSVEGVMRAARPTAATAAGSAGSTPARSTARATARYIEPVSR